MKLVQIGQSWYTAHGNKLRCHAIEPEKTWGKFLEEVPTGQLHNVLRNTSSTF